MSEVVRIGLPPARAGRQRVDLPLQLLNLGTQLVVGSERRPLSSRRQVAVVSPPVEPDLLSFVQGAHEEPNPDRQQLDLSQRHFDIAGYHQSLVENAIQNVDKPRGTVRRKVQSHAAGDYILGT